MPELPEPVRVAVWECLVCGQRNLSGALRSRCTQCGSRQPDTERSAPAMRPDDPPSCPRCGKLLGAVGLAPIGAQCACPRPAPARVTPASASRLRDIAGSCVLVANDGEKLRALADVLARLTPDDVASLRRAQALLDQQLRSGGEYPNLGPLADLLAELAPERHRG